MAVKLLVVTQKIDSQDSVLGFFHGWLRAFSAQFEKVTAVCLERGESSLPMSVKIFSLGKERGTPYSAFTAFPRRLRYIFNFYKIVWHARREYDSVLVHMNPEYVILGAFLWKILGKKVVLWYNHTFGGWRALLAFLLADKICHTSPFSFSANRRKSIRMPAGIDTNLFRHLSVEFSAGRKKPDVLYVGRISPLKDVRLLIQAMSFLRRRGRKYTLDIYGDAPTRDAGYLEKVKNAAGVQVGFITISSGQPHSSLPAIFSSARLFVNLTPSGNYDKTVLEAAACETVPLVSSKAFDDLLPRECFFKEGDADDLADRIEWFINLPEEERRKIGVSLRERVVDRHSLDKLVRELKNVL